MSYSIVDVIFHPYCSDENDDDNNHAASYDNDDDDDILPGLIGGLLKNLKEIVLFTSRHM